MTALTAADPTFSMQTGLHGNALRKGRAGCEGCRGALAQSSTSRKNGMVNGPSVNDHALQFL
jgi:hypothetical protein